MNIVLDSTVFVSDYFFDKPHHVLFKKFANKSIGDRVTIPQVVYEEILNKYREQCTKVSSQMRAVNPDFKDDVEKQCKKYSRMLVGLLKELNVEYLKYPTISHEKIVKRSLMRKKPFSESGKGYRDTLIWESILNLIKKGNKEIIFITDNYSDFCRSDKDNALHPQLFEDINLLGITGITTKIFRNIPAFNEEIVVPKLNKLEEIEKQLLTETHPYINLLELFEIHENDIKAAIDQVVNTDIAIKREHRTYSNIIDIPLIVWVSVHDTGNYELYIKFQILLTLELNFPISSENLASIQSFPGLRAWTGQDGGPLTITVECSLIVNQKTQYVSSFYLNSVKLVEH